MKEHFCSAEKSMITYEGSCNWCGEREGSMTEVLKLALKALNAGEHAHLIMNTDGIKDKVRQAIAESESQERNFCPRCGKRTNDIHTCTPPRENT